jgi:2-iminobutanoate/2-iminopropanoate deaminase
MGSEPAGGIIRSTPLGLDYLDPEVFTSLGFSQIVTAGPTVFISGIAPLRGASDSLDVQGGDDAGKQLEFVLGVLDRSLAAVGISREHLVAMTIYASSLEKLGPHLSAIADYVGDHPPTTTTVEVSGFLHPEQLIEITATAYKAA